MKIDNGSFLYRVFVGFKIMKKLIFDKSDKIFLSVSCENKKLNIDMLSISKLSKDSLQNIMEVTSHYKKQEIITDCKMNDLVESAKNIISKCQTRKSYTKPRLN